MEYMWHKYILETEDQMLKYICVFSTYDEKTFKKYNYIYEYDKYTYSDLDLINVFLRTKTLSLWKISDRVLVKYYGYEQQLKNDKNLNSILNMLNEKYPEGYYVESDKN